MLHRYSFEHFRRCFFVCVLWCSVNAINEDQSMVAFGLIALIMMPQRQHGGASSPLKKGTYETLGIGHVAGWIERGQRNGLDGKRGPHTDAVFVQHPL